MSKQKRRRPCLYGRQLRALVSMIENPRLSVLEAAGKHDASVHAVRRWMTTRLFTEALRGAEALQAHLLRNERRKAEFGQSRARPAATEQPPPVPDEPAALPPELVEAARPEPRPLTDEEFDAMTIGREETA